MEFSIIEPRSRYFRLFYDLKGKISISQYFKNGKPIEILYSPVTESIRLISVVKHFFNVNLFDNDEKKLFLFNLIHFTKKYGALEIQRIIRTNDNAKLFRKHNIQTWGEISELMIKNELISFPSEQAQLIKSILLFRESLNTEIKMYFDELRLPQPIAKQKPVLISKSITFKNNEIIEKLHSELIGYFPEQEDELLKALRGEQLNQILLFPHNQNKFVEVFRRLKYNGFILNKDKQVMNWICTTFQFIKKGNTEPQPFKENSVWDNLNKGKGEPTKKERICITEWLPYKSPSQLKEETKNEKL